MQNWTTSSAGREDLPVAFRRDEAQVAGWTPLAPVPQRSEAEDFEREEGAFFRHFLREAAES